ncbi:MAG: CHASE domain-containing protein [Acidimicrobiia bacterium]|nr:CHASE domain-containing protein [Acidimicrobiia bacterium]
MAATIGRGLGAPIYLGRVTGLLDGAVADDSASLARVAGPLPSNGVVGTIALAKVDGTRVVVTAEVPAESPALAVGTDLAAMAANRVAFDLARDDGTPSLADAQRSATGETSALIAYPQYGSPSIPATTEDRRGKVQGYLVALVTPRPVVELSLTGEALKTTGITITDGPQQLYASPAAMASSARRSLVQRSVPLANHTWTVTAWAGPGAVPSHPPWWAIVLAVLAFLASGVGLTAILRSASRESRAREQERAEEVRLIADAGPLLQQSLDLGELLPDFAVQLAAQFELDRLGVAVANDDGELVDTFSIGPAPGPRRLVRQVGPTTDEVEPGDDFVIPLQRTGRTVGALRARSRRLLERPQLASLRAVSDLLAAALGNAQLYQREQETVRRLRDLDRMKLSFLSTVSHELRTAVAAIEGFGSLLVEHWPTLADEQRREFIDRIARNAGSLKRLVDDLLDFARLERHALTVSPRLVSLSDMVRQTVEQFASLLEQHHLALDIKPDVIAFTDPDAVERILGNFLSNAAKYAPPDTAITVTVEPSGSRALLAVSDQGPGIPAEERTRIFTRFYRSETEATHRTRGAGIGLAIVKEFADRLNASVAVDTAEGGGARFVALFPTEPGMLAETEMSGRAVPDLVE